MKSTQGLHNPPTSSRTSTATPGQPVSASQADNLLAQGASSAFANVPTRESVTTISGDGSRRFIHAAQAKGRFTTWRALMGLALMAVYFALPWIPVNGHPAVFLDLAVRQFHFFGFTFVTQDLWLAFFLVSGVAFSLFYVSALFGRVWCGWGCPQTVFLDLARRIERWCEGDAPARRRLDRMPSNFAKTFRRGLKNLLYLGFSLVLAHVLLSYFVSLPGLYAMMHSAPGEHWGAFLFVIGLTAVLWFDLAWFREQFCIILCPYGRLQSALIDDNSLVVGYDARRGEPRGRKGTPGAGACVDCKRCVQVCPTGIDIRQGLQIECIGCSACIDACDTVMDKIGRPRGLIRYDSANGLAGKATRWVRPRIILYTGLMLLGAAALTAGLTTLKPVTISLTRLPGIPYVVSGGDVRNEFLLRVLNKRNQPVTFELTIEGGPKSLSRRGGEGGIVVGPLGEQMLPVVVTIPRAELHGKLPLRVRVTSKIDGTTIEKTVPFLGPML